MNKLDHDIEAPEGWTMDWVERDMPALSCYTSLVSIFLGLCMLFTAVRSLAYARRARRELAANPSDRAAIFKRTAKQALTTDKAQLKIAFIYMAHSYIISIIDGGIAVFMLAKDVSENSEVWDKEMVLSLGLYSIYALVLFVAAFVLVPMLQVLVVTWGLTRFVKKGNALSDYVPQARSCSTIMALFWSIAAFYVVRGWPIVDKSGQDQTTLRFLILEGVWGSAMAWLEAAISFCYLSHVIGDKELMRGNGVGEVSNMPSICICASTDKIDQVVSLFAKAAAAPFKKAQLVDLPVYEEDGTNSEKQPLISA